MGTEPLVLTARDGDVVTITMNRPNRRNALSLLMLEALLEAFTTTAHSDARGVVLAGAGRCSRPAHDFADLAGADESTVRRMLAPARS